MLARRAQDAAQPLLDAQQLAPQGAELICSSGGSEATKLSAVQPCRQHCGQGHAVGQLLGAQQLALQGAQLI